MAKRSPLHAARRQARRAILRGDLDAAVRWTMIMRYQVRMARQVADLANPRPRPRPKPPKPPKPVPPQPIHSGPVMLDPKGFSPGGTPNWFLNHKRRERAGLE